MGQIDHPFDRDTLSPYGQPTEAPASAQRPDFIDLADDEPPAAARGVVNGVILGIVLWTVILWVLI